jgi:SAM-dependent methyltransferase
MTSSAQRVADDGYAALALLYDEYVGHPGYRHWVLSIEAAARALGVRGVRLLDVGCGTGRSFAPLLERGYLVTGCEPVGPMRDEARRRSPRRVRLAHDLVWDAPAGPFDLVLALNDVVHCVPDAAQLRATLAAVAARLADGGVFAFDVTPPDAHARLFGRASTRTTARADFAWEPRAGDAAAGARVARLRVRPAGRPERVTVHRQRTLDAGELRAALAGAGLRVAAVRGCDNEGHLLATRRGAFKHIYFAQLAHATRRKEVPDAHGAQAAPQGRRHAGGRQGRVIATAGAAVPAAPTGATEHADGR